MKHVSPGEWHKKALGEWQKMCNSWVQLWSLPEQKQENEVKVPYIASCLSGIIRSTLVAVP